MPDILVMGGGGGQSLDGLLAQLMAKLNVPPAPESPTAGFSASATVDATIVTDPAA